MNVNLPETLRRGADFLQDMHRKQHPDIHILWTPWYIEAMREAAEELERHQEVFNEDALLRMTGQYLGTTPERLRELVQAEREGRLVVLPCKVGETVWVAGEKRVLKCEIDEAHLDDVKGLEYLVSFNCEYQEQGGDYCNGCPFYGWHQDYSGEWDCDGVWGNASVMGADFGKTVFLTREEAEAALKGEGGG